MANYIIGASVGQPGQSTAIVILEKVDGERGAEYHIVAAERFLPRAPFQIIAARLQEMYDKIQFSVKNVPGDPREYAVENTRAVAVDITGVGDPVLKLLEGERSFIDSAITIITGGTAKEDRPTGRWSVPSKDLVGVLLILFQAERIIIPGTLREKDLLLHEFLALGNDTRVKHRKDKELEEEYEREKENDDYVLAVAVAAWEGEKGQPEYIYFPAGDAPGSRVLPPRGRRF